MNNVQTIAWSFGWWALVIALTFNIASATFPKVKVINVPRHSSRRLHMKNELASHNIAFEWLDAVDGLALTRGELISNCTAMGRYFMTPGMIGCFLSHKKCWEYCVRSGNPLLVFEDDVVLEKNFCEVVTVAMDKLEKMRISNDNRDHRDKEWDVLLLGALGCVHPDKKKYGLNWIPSLVGGKWRKTRYVSGLDMDGIGNCKKPCIHVPMCPYGGHAYILSPTGAEKLLQHCPRASYHVDVIAWGLKDLNILAIHPLISWQTNNDTTIGGFVHILKKLRIPRLVADSYTGFEIGWALSAPLLRLGGPYFGGNMLLTNGNSLAIMFLGSVVGILQKSPLILGLTAIYVIAVTILVRILSSSWNR
mmetsp:Transcript_4758/g.7217  ORF Transcript_4758/g.7217 Transcript_4758/m.7217 type:complete len:363 (-) Transcript_4758:1028-2116(-)